MDGDCVDVIRGKSIIQVAGAALRARAAAATWVAVDVGAGDGRLAYRLARAHPDWLCVAVDANAANLRETSFRATRKASRGGAANAWFVRAAVEALPGALEEIADEITVHYPWGSLLRTVIEPVPDLLRRVARLGRPGAAFRVRVNTSALAGMAAATQGLRAHGLDDDVEARLRRGYETAGIRLESCGVMLNEAATAWGRRLNNGRPVTVVALDGIVA